MEGRTVRVYKILHGRAYYRLEVEGKYIDRRNDSDLKRFVKVFEFVSDMEKNPAAVELGKIKSPKKAKTSRDNGKKGGRPKKV